MNKRTTETIYRSRPTKDRPKGDRWIFVEATKEHGEWLMARVRDGHRMFVNPCRLVIEGTFPPVSATTIKQPITKYEYNVKEKRMMKVVEA